MLGRPPAGSGPPPPSGMDPTTPSTPTPATGAPPQSGGKRSRRGCLGCLFHGSLGCLAFLIGSFAAAALFAPTLLGGLAGRWLQQSINDRIAGRIEIRDLELAWGQRQQGNDVTLYDVDGKRVASLKLTFPGILTLLDSERERWRIQARIKTAEVVRDPEGGTNLERALAPRGSVSSGARITIDSFDSDRGLDQSFPFTLQVTGGSEAQGGTVVVRGPTAEEEEILLARFDLTLEHEPGRSDRLRGEAQVTVGDRTGEISGEASLLRGSDAAVTVLEADWTLEDLPTVVVDACLGEAYTSELFGSTLTGRWTATPDGQATLLAIGLDGERLQFTGRVEDGVLTAAEEGLVAHLNLPHSLCEEFCDPYLPQRTTLHRHASDSPWKLSLSDFRVPVGWPGGDLPARADLLAGLGGTFALEGAQVALVDEAGEELTSLTEPRLTLALDAGGTPRLEVTGKTDHPDGRFRLELTGSSDLAHVVDGASGYALDLEAHGLPARALDYTLGYDGTVAALFGSHPDLRLTRPAPDAPMALSIVNHEGRGELQGTIVDGRLVMGEEESLELDFPLDERPMEAIVTPLLPWLTELEKPEGSEPAHLTIHGLDLMLGEDLRRAKALATLSLGHVRFRLHPGFHGLFNDSRDERSQIEAVLPPVRMRLDREIVDYQELALILGPDEEYDLLGELDRRTGDVDLDAEVPLRYATPLPLPGTEDPLVEVVIRGPWQEPEMMMNRDVLKTLTQGIESILGVLDSDEEPDQGD